MLKLIYIYDPLCGWCYGAEPLLEIAAQHSSIQLELHAGGMLANDRKLLINDSFRQHIIKSDQRIAAITGQPFTAAYRQMLSENNLTFDSAPPITAILAAGKQSQQDFAMLKAIQHAHYVMGRRISENEVLFSIATEIGLDKTQFITNFNHFYGKPTQRHVDLSRDLLNRSGSSGFPTLLIGSSSTDHLIPSDQSGELQPIALADFLGDHSRWKKYLDQLSDHQ
ncbi:DsbA family protein [Moellerella wisconsensis]|nr:DsbA family protein [Moellerella wisconsensis]VFS54467.1 DSBA-like thioredoxin domain [Moellerella wisconsensis]